MKWWMLILLITLTLGMGGCATAGYVCHTQKVKYFDLNPITHEVIGVRWMNITICHPRIRFALV